MNKTWLHKPGSVLVIILCLGLALRLFMVWHSGNTVRWEDEQDYLQLATHIVEGKGFTLPNGAPTAFRAPGYPAMLALGMSVGVHSVMGMKIINALLGTATIWLSYKLGQMLLGDRTALLTAGFTAMYPYYIYMPSVLLATTLFTAIILAATLLLHRSVQSGRWHTWVCSGLLFGVAALVRPSALVLLAAAVLWVLFVAPGTTPVWRHGLLVVLAALLVTTPWMIRNSSAVGAHSLTTNAWRNLWLGNNPAATANSGSSVELPPDLERRLAGRDEVGKERIYRENTLRYIQEYPGRFVRLSLSKGLALWRLTPGESTATKTDNNPWLRWTSRLCVGSLLLLAIIGFYTAPTALRKEMLLWLYYAIGFTLLHAVIISKVRFRLPLDVYLIIAAAMSAERLIDDVLQKVINNTNELVKGSGGV